ncbi:MAG: polymer-forming cytoskeletal protein [Halobacteria archaeon]
MAQTLQPKSKDSKPKSKPSPDSIPVAPETVQEQLFSAFVVPEGCVFDEQTVTADADIFVGEGSKISYGLSGLSVFVGPRVEVSGDVAAEEDLRLDRMARIGGDARAGGDVSLGELAKVEGKLAAAGDLTLGQGAAVAGGFESTGTLTLQNPYPVILFILFYLATVLGLSGKQGLEKLFETLEAQSKSLIVPPGSTVEPDSIRTSRAFRAGRECRLLGNIEAARAEVGPDTVLVGSLRARGNIQVASGADIHGSVVSKATVFLAPGCRVRGSVEGKRIRLHRETKVEGKLRAAEGVRFLD